MRKRISLPLAASLVWASTTAAADVPDASAKEPSYTPEAATPRSSTSHLTKIGSATTSSAAGDARSPAERDAPLVNRPLFVFGAITFAATYIPMIAVAQNSNRPADQANLYYPIVGPWLNLMDRQCDARPCGGETINKTVLIVDGIGQGVGVIAMVASFFVPSKAPKTWYLFGDESGHAGPTRVGTGYGMGAAGRF